ncbi:MAG: DUF2156 domain-containing protein [Bacteroidales bacterium]
MLTFRPVTLNDRDIVKGYMQRYPRRGLNYSFEVLYLWQESCEFEIAEYEGFLLIKTFINCNHNFLFPIGEGNLRKVIEQMVAYSKARKCSFNIYQIREDERIVIEELFPNRFEFEQQRNEMEYIYLRDKLSTLQGKKLQSKRNHINALCKEHNWSFEHITQENLVECIELNERWKEEIEEKIDRQIMMENEALEIGFRDLSKLKLQGGALRIDGNIEAFAIGTQLTSDTYLILFEKANAELRGAYPLINREFVNNIIDTSIQYVNRAEDAGDDGLRKAKLSYYPDLLDPLYMAYEKVVVD